MTTPDSGAVEFAGHALVKSPPAHIQRVFNRLCISQILWSLCWPLVALLVFLPAITADLADLEILLAAYLAAGVRVLGALKLRARQQWTWAMHAALAGADAALLIVVLIRLLTISLGADSALIPMNLPYRLLRMWPLPTSHYYGSVCA